MSGLVGARSGVSIGTNSSGVASLCGWEANEFIKGTFPSLHLPRSVCSFHSGAKRKLGKARTPFSNCAYRVQTHKRNNDNDNYNYI